MISLLETEKCPALRLWILNYSDNLFARFNDNISTETITFMRSMAKYQVSESYLMDCLDLIKSARSELALPMCSILSNNPCYMTYRIASCLLSSPLQPFCIKSLERLARLSIADEIKSIGLSVILESKTETQTNIIIEMLSILSNIPLEMYEYYLGKIKNSGSDKEAENIYIEYQNYLTSLDNFEADLNSLSSIDLIKAIESCPDLLDRECDRSCVELAILRSRRRKEE